MKGVIKLLLVLFLALPLTVKTASSDIVPQLQEGVSTRIVRSKPDFRPHSKAGFDLIELQLQQDQNEWENTYVDWSASLADGTRIPIIYYPNRSRTWYRIPPSAIIPPHTGENSSDDFMVRLQITARNPGFLGRSFIGRWLNIDQGLIGFSINCYFNRDAVYTVDPYPNHWPLVPVQAYLSVDKEYPIPVINLKLPLYERLQEIVDHRALIYVDPEHARAVLSQQSYQTLNEEEEAGNLDEVDFDELPVTDKSDAAALTREEIQLNRQIQQPEQQWNQDEHQPTYIIWIAASGVPIILGHVPEVTSELVDYVQSYSVGFQSGF